MALRNAADPTVVVPSEIRAELRVAQSLALQSLVQISAAVDLDVALNAVADAAGQTVAVVTSEAFLFQSLRDPVHVSQLPPA